MNLEGSLVALVTPFTNDNEVDYHSLKKLILWHLEEKTSGIVILGTTAEVSTLGDSEKQKIIEYTCSIVQKKIPVIVGVGTNCTARTVAATRTAKELGADYGLVIAPYYNCPNQLGLVLHYQKAADEGLPLIIYHHPKRTGVQLDFDTLLELQKHPKITAIKDATGNLAWMEKIVTETKLKLFSGNDENTFEIMTKGAVGSISVVANLIPGEWSKMHKLLLDKKFEDAKLINDKYMPLIEALSFEVNPQGVKFALSLIKKYCLSDLRLPLIKPSFENQLKISEVLNQTLSSGIVASS